jgi:hypothetical protein
MIFVRYYLWIAPHILLAGVLAGLVRRRFLRQFPIFTAFVAFQLIQFLVLFAVALHSPFSLTVYQGLLVLGQVISSVLELGVIYELANKLIFSRSPLAAVLRPILRGTFVVLLLAAAVGSGSLANVSVHRITNVFETVDFSSNLIQAGMLLALFIFARVLRISWRNWMAGVVLGFGISASIDLAAAALRAAFGKDSFIAVDITQMAAFHVCVLIWLVFLFRSDANPILSDTKLNLSDFEPWDEELQRMVRR